MTAVYTAPNIEDITHLGNSVMGGTDAFNFWGYLNELGTRITSAEGGVGVNVTDYGAVGDGVTDDRPAVILAVAAAIAESRPLLFPSPGTYKLSKYVEITGAHGLRITATGPVTILYASDDNTIPTDAVATLAPQAQSAFFIRNSVGVTVDGLVFQGGTNPSLNINEGPGVYARNCRDLTITRCGQMYGAALLNQDAVNDGSGQGDSLTNLAGVTTLADAGATWTVGVVGREITLSGTTEASNSGKFTVLSRPSATSITYANAAGITETSSFRWAVNDGDRGTTINDCLSYGCRGVHTICSHSQVHNHHVELPMSPDVCGIGGTFTFATPIVTLTSTAGRFLPSHHGKYITIAGATTGANNVTAKLTYVSATAVSYTNAAGVAEALPLTGSWWILNGDKVGVGDGVAGLTQNGATQNVKTAAAMFTAADVNKSLRIAGSATAANNTQSIITAFVSSTEVTINNAAGATDATFAGPVTIDAYDHGTNVTTMGSTHAWYLFAGRQNVLFTNCYFRGIRTTCLKVSGSSLPIRGIRMVNSYAEECGVFALYGADDAQEHTDFLCANNTIVDCCTQRVGWDNSAVIEVLGSRGSIVANNTIHFTRNHIASVSGVSNGTQGIVASRYVAGCSQPCEDLTISGNKFTCEPNQTTAGSIIANDCINVIEVGIHAKWSTSGAITKSGSVCTLTDNANGFFLTKEDVGKSITFVFSTDAGNDGTFVITSCTAHSVSFTNAGGVARNPVGGTWRLPQRAGHRGGACSVRGNEIYGIGANGIGSSNSIGVSIEDNVVSNTLAMVRLYGGDLYPRVTGNRMVGTGTESAGIRITPSSAWPWVEKNQMSGASVGSSVSRDVGISVSGATAVDHPLLGAKGRVRPSDGKEEVVIAYGGLPVDGDTLQVVVTAVSDVTYTYKTTAPAGNQFNSFAGLVALIDAQAGLDCADYGTGFTAGDVATQHLRIRRSAATDTTDGTLTVTPVTLNPNFLACPRNDNAAGRPGTDGRGSGAAGPTADKTVVWSPACSWSGLVVLAPDNTAARTLMATSYQHAKSAADAGSCDLLVHGTSAGTEEFRFAVH